MHHPIAYANIPYHCIEFDMCIVCNKSELTRLYKFSCNCILPAHQLCLENTDMCGLCPICSQLWIPMPINSDTITCTTICVWAIKSIGIIIIIGIIIGSIIYTAHYMKNL